ncbi:hypothetical protein MAR_022407 [Mya arenaria]|uniref:Short-chain collagen C4 n=2 Tax=Mya arenaria TaxID=6604 RepID=A0ABY7DL07_MYAAR|nr:hypothetical protein MAR_022407 [Mya arenaria]
MCIKETLSSRITALDLHLLSTSDRSRIKDADMFVSIMCAALMMLVSAEEDIPYIKSRFSYEYSVISKLVELENDKKELGERINVLTSELNDSRHDFSLLNASLQAIIQRGRMSSGSTYVRWGKSDCPSDTGSRAIYKGYVASGDHTHAGGSGEFICLPEDPIHGDDITGGYRSLIVGTEYETGGTSKWADVVDHDVPCVTCYTPSSNVLMVPGRNQCYEGWNLEYSGYLMSSYYNHASPKNYLCVNDYPENLDSGYGSENGALLYFVAARCGSLPCDPYIDNGELTCAVCTLPPY